MRKPRNTELALVLKNDPTRLRERVVESEKSKRRKNRSRRKQHDDDETVDEID